LIYWVLWRCPLNSLLERSWRHLFGHGICNITDFCHYPTPWCIPSNFYTPLSGAPQKCFKSGPALANADPARRYETIGFSQLAIDTAIISIICKAIRRLGKTLSSPYSTMLLHECQEVLRTRQLLRDVILAFCNLKPPRIIACHLRLNCTKPLFLTHRF